MVFRNIIQYIPYIFLLSLLSLFKVIGRKYSSNISSYFFTLIGPYTKHHKRAKRNIKIVWPRIERHEGNKILFNMWSNIGRNFGEFVFLNREVPQNNKYVKIYGIKILKKIFLVNKRKKKGIIFFSAHYGNWELAPKVLSSLGLDILTIYRKSNNKYINNLVQSMREKYASYTPKGDVGAKKSFLWLRRGKSLALAMDQKLNEGKIVKFLGKDAYTASAIAELAIRMNLDIVPIKTLRKELYNEVSFYSKLKKPSNHLTHEQKVFFILEEVNSLLSKWIKEDPSQWLWIHRRWSKDLYD